MNFEIIPIDKVYRATRLERSRCLTTGALELHDVNLTLLCHTWCCPQGMRVSFSTKHGPCASVAVVRFMMTNLEQRRLLNYPHLKPLLYLHELWLAGLFLEHPPF